MTSPWEVPYPVKFSQDPAFTPPIDEDDEYDYEEYYDDEDYHDECEKEE